MLEAGLPFNPGLVRRGEYRARSGREMAGLLLDEGRRPDAFLAANNVLAMGVLEALHERGLRIPQERPWYVSMICPTWPSFTRSSAWLPSRPMISV